MWQQEAEEPTVAVEAGVATAGGGGASDCGRSRSNDWSDKWGVGLVEAEEAAKVVASTTEYKQGSGDGLLVSDFESK